ncbi:MAG: penicillin-binding protein 2 [Lachnospira sp.]|nr:penicillin-binding protein 2 [Lachnospira sp.]
MATKKKKNKYGVFFISMKRKLIIMFLLIALIVIGLIVRIAVINYKDGSKYRKIVLGHQAYSTTVIPYMRGSILDRSGTVLAYSEKKYHLVLDASEITYNEKRRKTVIDTLTKYLDVTADEINAALDKDTTSKYQRFKRYLSYSEVSELIETVENDKIKGIYFEEEYVRQYPFSSLASDVIGFTIDGSGSLGLEMYYNDQLSGTDGIRYGYLNDSLNLETNSKNPIDGNNVVTTIDYTVQTIIEKCLKQYNEEVGSKNSAVIIQNPKTGEILGMASYPFYDLNNPRDLSAFYTPEEIAAMDDATKLEKYYALWKNYCIAETYEPGSVIKPFTVATALEEGVITTAYKCNCDGHELIKNSKIHCHKRSGHGMLTLKEAVMYSCNDAMMQITSIMGTSLMQKYQNIYNFGYKTGIDLPGEEIGLLYTNMTELDAATNSFGQNMNVTMIQVVSGFSSLVNGGNYYQPQLLKSITTANGEVVYNNSPILVKQTITKSTSEALREYLKATVESGTAKTAGVNGYSIGGKTGTAEKLPREDKKYLVSFLGAAPIEDPQVVVYVIVDEANAENADSSSHAQLIAHNIFVELLPYLNILPDSVEEDVIEEGTNDSIDNGTVFE